VDDALVEEYNAELRGLVNDLRGLQEAQTSVNQLVSHQQNLLDIGEKNVVQADSNLTAGTVDIEETRDLACAIRWKKLIIAIVVISVLIVIGIIITLSIVLQPKAAKPSTSPTAMTPS